MYMILRRAPQAEECARDSHSDSLSKVNVVHADQTRLTMVEKRLGLKNALSSPCSPLVREPQCVNVDQHMELQKIDRHHETG